MVARLATAARWPNKARPWASCVSETAALCVEGLALGGVLTYSSWRFFLLSVCLPRPVSHAVPGLSFAWLRITRLPIPVDSLVHEGRLALHTPLMSAAVAIVPDDGGGGDRQAAP